MSAMTVGGLEIGAVGTRAPGARSGFVPPRTRSRSERPATASQRGPVARPLVRAGDRRGQRPAGVAAPRVVRRPQPVVAASPGWRLTDRGLAVVMALGLVLVAIALSVVVSTALTVTDDNYRPTASVRAR